MLAMTISGSLLSYKDTAAGKLHLAYEHHELIYPSVDWLQSWYPLGLAASHMETKPSLPAGWRQP